MSPSNMISVIVATCFGVFIGLGNTSLLYYAAKVSDSVQGKGIWKVQSLRRSADNVGEMPQLASIPGCQSGGSQEIGRAQNSAILATAQLRRGDCRRQFLLFNFKRRAVQPNLRHLHRRRFT